jgi:hypothetical protein
MFGHLAVQAFAEESYNSLLAFFSRFFWQKFGKLQTF